MANTLTDLYPDMYEGLDVVSRELVGFIPAVSGSLMTERAAIGQTVRVPVAPSASTANNTPAVTAPDTGDQSISNVDLAITKSKHVAIRWNGEETRGLTNAGTFRTVNGDRFAQAFRALVNEIEMDLWLEAYKTASRAYGATAGTAPFATANDLSDFAGVLRVLEENGAPRNDLQLVLGHAAMANLRGKQSVLFKVNEAGSQDMLRNGFTDRVMNFAIRQSDVINPHTAGGMTGADVNQALGEAVGQTTITFDGGTVNSTGIKAGDLITFAGDTNKYNVVTGSTDTGGDIVIARPGLRVAAADTTEITVVATHTPNVAFARSAIVLATRQPALPEGGDMADERTVMTDPLTGISFEVALYRQFRQTVAHVAIAWGFKTVKQEHVAILHG